MNLGLLTDYYELSMMQGYYFTNRQEEAVFDMFFRRQPFGGGFTVFAGLDPLIDAIVGPGMRNFWNTCGVFVLRAMYMRWTKAVLFFQMSRC